MIHYQTHMQHDENTLRLLSRKQYDLFSKGNQVGRAVISFAALVFGALNFEQWWGVMLLLYGSYMTSSKYAAADHKVKKIVNGLKSAGLSFPASRCLFRDNAVEIIAMPENTSLGDPLMYEAVKALAEDDNYFYLFPNELGGYMIPIKELGKEASAFRRFMEEKTGKSFAVREIPLMKVIRFFKRRAR